MLSFWEKESFLLAALLLFSSRAARAVDVSVDFHPAPTALAGTLSPFVVSLDGKIIFRSNDRYRVIELDGAKLPLQRDRAHSFFLKTTSDTLHIVTRDAYGRVQVRQEVFLPRIQTAELEETTGQWYFSIAGSVKEVLVDGKSIPFRDGNAKWLPPDGAMRSDRTHIMEIHGPVGEPDRFYNLQFKVNAKPPRPVVKAKPVEAPTWPRLVPASFNLGVLTLFRSGQSASLGGEAAWTPRLALAPAFGLRGNFGVEPLSKAGGGHFVGIETELLLSYHLGPVVLVEGGGGTHIWPGNGGALVSASALVSLDLVGNDRVRLYAGYTNLFATPAPWLLKFGLGFTF